MRGSAQHPIQHSTVAHSTAELDVTCKPSIYGNDHERSLTRRLVLCCIVDQKSTGVRSLAPDTCWEMMSVHVLSIQRVYCSTTGLTCAHLGYNRNNSVSLESPCFFNERHCPGFASVHLSGCAVYSKT